MSGINARIPDLKQNVMTPAFSAALEVRVKSDEETEETAPIVNPKKAMIDLLEKAIENSRFRILTPNMDPRRALLLVLSGAATSSMEISNAVQPVPDETSLEAMVAKIILTGASSATQIYTVLARQLRVQAAENVILDSVPMHFITKCSAKVKGKDVSLEGDLTKKRIVAFMWKHKDILLSIQGVEKPIALRDSSILTLANLLRLTVGAGPVVIALGAFIGRMVSTDAQAVLDTPSARVGIAVAEVIPVLSVADHFEQFLASQETIILRAFKEALDNIYLKDKLDVDEIKVEFIDVLSQFLTDADMLKFRRCYDAAIKGLDIEASLERVVPKHRN